MKDTNFRPLSKLERKIIKRLFDLDFLGREELLQQFSDLKVKQIDDNGSLRFQVRSSVVSPIQRGPVVEARYCDSDATEINRVCVNILLHVKDGKMWMLEIYKDNSSPVLRKPRLDELELFTQYPRR